MPIELVQLFAYIVVLALVIVACFFTTKFIAKKMNGVKTFSSARIMIIERVMFTADKGMAICKVCTKYYLVSFATNDIKIMAELDPDFFKQDETQSNMMQTVIDAWTKNRKG